MRWAYWFVFFWNVSPWGLTKSMIFMRKQINKVSNIWPWKNLFLIGSLSIRLNTNHCLFNPDFFRGHCEGGPTARSKNLKTPFFERYWKILSRGYSNGSRTLTFFFSFWNISTNMVARGIWSFGRNGLWLAGWLSNGQNFCVKFAQTCDKKMLKISSRYLNPYLI